MMPSPENYKTLSPKEKLVFDGLVHGLTSEEIAKRNDNSKDTIDCHKYKIYVKLKVHNEAQMVRYAVVNNLLRINDIQW